MFGFIRGVSEKSRQLVDSIRRQREPPGAGLRITNCLIFLKKHWLNAG